MVSRRNGSVESIKQIVQYLNDAKLDEKVGTLNLDAISHYTTMRNAKLGERQTRKSNTTPQQLRPCPSAALYILLQVQTKLILPQRSSSRPPPSTSSSRASISAPASKSPPKTSSTSRTAPSPARSPSRSSRTATSRGRSWATASAVLSSRRMMRLWRTRPRLRWRGDWA
jgi:hypothetical protein